ncbi:MAG: hypothetical protein L6R38_007951, partial [Xanthoria sp. 2 TBL-2021]
KKTSLTLKFAHKDMLADFAALPGPSSSATRGGAAWASVDDISSSRAAASAARAWNRFEVGGAEGASGMGASAAENPGLVDVDVGRMKRKGKGKEKEEGKSKGKGKGKQKETDKPAPPPTTTKSGRVTKKRERLVEEEGGL